MLETVKNSIIDFGVKQAKDFLDEKFGCSIMRSSFNYDVTYALYHVIEENPKNLERLLKKGNAHTHGKLGKFLKEVRLHGKLSKSSINDLASEFYLGRNITDLLFYHGNYTFIRIQQILENDERAISTSSTKIQYVVFSFYGKMAYRLMKQFLHFEKKIYEDCASIFSCSDKGVYMLNEYGENYREKDSVIVPDCIVQRIFSYLKNAIFLSKFMYKKAHATISPGILFYGNPGTGKSSIVELIAREFNCDIFYIDISNIYMAQNLVREEIYQSGLTRKKIFVFEDIDIVATRRDEQDNKSVDCMDANKNFNILLQILDGYLSRPDVIKIATTNYIEKIDPALIRFGRFDLKIKMGDFDRPLAEKMCKNFRVSTKLLDLVSFPVNPAELQACIMENFQEYRLDKQPLH